jgi:DNA-binding response OmpR family regulator
MTALLLVEDDKSLGETLFERLQKEHYLVIWAQTLQAARLAVQREKVDLAVVDLSLPDGSGFDFAKELKAHTKIPFVFLTALNSAENRLTGYELGADEFIPKPFHLKELLLRVKRVLEKNKLPQQLVVGEILIDVDAMSVKLPDGKLEHPQTRDFKLLLLLINSAPNVVSREQVLKELFPDTNSSDELPTQRTIDNSILRLRQLFKSCGQDYIRSVRGIGYQWVSPVQAK